MCRPVEDKVKRGTTVREEVTLPLSVARIYLSLGGGWNLPVSKGFCAAPLLSVDGSINCSAGYDRASGLWCLGTDAPPISSKPTTEDARNLLRFVHGTFASFPFADSARLEANGGGSMLDVSKDPGADESAFLMALMTAVCRPSLPLAPALLIRAPRFSGSGTGKGLLVRAIGETAFGRRPKAFARRGDRQELSKRLDSALMQSDPMLFLDSCNDETLASDVLAQVITETEVKGRVLGRVN